MKIHEHQAKEIFASFGIEIPEGSVAYSTEEVIKVAEELKYPVAIKSQVLVGGRGKAGGIKIAKDRDEVERFGGEILSLSIKGLPVEKVLVEKGVDIAEEYYIGVIVDREKRMITFMVSPEGGVEIEEVAKNTPDKILKLSVDPSVGFFDFQARKLASFLVDDFKGVLKIASEIKKLYRCFRCVDASLAEINPFVRLKDGEFLALDAKINIDDNALFRQPDIEKLRDVSAEGEFVNKARKAGLSYIPLDGNIACIVNGAGLAMCTMDLIKHFGGEPANFLDIGGSSSPEKTKTALEIIDAQGGTESILINIFGGITRCDDVARGIASAMEDIEMDVPITVRLTGTNEEEGVKILEEVGITTLTDMDEAVKVALEKAG
jgi:succinyl-CoA synthetase beta subunit